LNVVNGTIDLRNGVLKPHDRADLITELLPIDYDPDATSNEWDTFLRRIFSDNADLIAYVQRGMGYSITGDQSEQTFFFCYGSGFNGKSTLLNTCRLVLGNYATQVPPTAFMVDKNKRGGPDEAIANLRNKRLVCSTELEDGQKLSVSLVKRMTGGEPLWCEHKFERGYNFQPTHKLWLSGNHEPIITDTTNSIWLRLKKIPFMLEIPENERKKGYAEYLAGTHNQAILTWLVHGCVEWKRTGSLGEPETVTRAVAEYRDQQDILHDYLIERCLFARSATIDQRALYADYKKWCEDNDTYVISKPGFSNRIREKGAIAGRRHGNRATWIGIRLLTDDEAVNTVNQVTDFSESFLHEASTGKTLHKIVNPVTPVTPVSLDNPSSRQENPSGKSVSPSGKLAATAAEGLPPPWGLPPPYPTELCPKCGKDAWGLSTNGADYYCTECYPEGAK
jgi:putative DNA primase/helicase